MVQTKLSYWKVSPSAVPPITDANIITTNYRNVRVCYIMVGYKFKVFRVDEIDHDHVSQKQEDNQIDGAFNCLLRVSGPSGVSISFPNESSLYTLR